MSSLIQALDNKFNNIDINNKLSNIQFGENGHAEYRWSTEIKDKIVQLNFQLTRIRSDNELVNVTLIHKQLLYEIVELSKKPNINVDELNSDLLMLYKMVGFTRDIIGGKGEYKLTYMMINNWYNISPDLAKYAINCLVSLPNGQHPYGSWKDIKYFCDYCYTENKNRKHPLIQHCIELLNQQLRIDFESFNNSENKPHINISLVSKWIPRDFTKYNWLYEQLATNYFVDYFKKNNNDTQYQKALLKAKTNYRKILSTLNRHLDTLQIKQCSNNWSSINFNNVTSVSIAKQKNAFLNINNSGKIRYNFNQDRILCSENFNQFINSKISSGKNIKGKRVSMVDFSKQALKLIRDNMGDSTEINEQNKLLGDLLNLQWRDNSTQNSPLGKMITMVDVSASMDGDPLYAALALGIRIAEKSILGKRVLTFSNNPKWCDLRDCYDFMSSVEKIISSDWGCNTNFYLALNVILDAIIASKLSQEETEDMVLVILSDMQIDEGGNNCNVKTLYETMEIKYAEAGLRIIGKPYKPPHILFWNLRSTGGFPNLSSQKNTSMMSGFSPVLLNTFCDLGMSALKSCTPFFVLEKALNNDRYKIMEDEFTLHNYILRNNCCPINLS